jgi:translation initiation factor IF-1
MKKIEMEGEVVEAFPNGMFKIQLDAGHEVLGYTAGKMRRYRIRIFLGDRVRVERRKLVIGLCWSSTDVGRPISGSAVRSRSGSVPPVLKQRTGPASESVRLKFLASSASARRCLVRTLSRVLGAEPVKPV